MGLGDTWLSTTRQAWKLWTGNIVAAVGIGGSVVLLSSGVWPADLCGLFVAPAGVIGALLLDWSIRCRVCGYRPVIRAIVEMPLSKWAFHVHGMSECPSCGDPGSAPSERARPTVWHRK